MCPVDIQSRVQYPSDQTALCLKSWNSHITGVRQEGKTNKQICFLTIFSQYLVRRNELILTGREKIYVYDFVFRK